MAEATAGGGGSAGWLVSGRGILLAFAAALLLSWPMLILSAPLVFPDTLTYVNQGHELVLLLLDALLPGGSEAHRADEYLSSKSLRSAPYAVFLYITSRDPLSLLVPALLQGAAVLLLVGALVRRELEAPPALVFTAMVACATLTSLPWFTSFLMPDILAAGVVLYAALLVRGFDTLSRPQQILVCGIATFATSSHYGHIPLAAACFGAAGLILLVQRRLTWAVTLAAATPILLAVAVNAVLGQFAYDGPSAAPRRLPLLLARSIEDGPARWHLEEACTEERYAVCAIFEDELPDNVRDVLWGQGGLAALDAEAMAQIREEELEILWQAFRDYPAQQIWSLIGNAAEQLVSLGTAEFRMATIGYTEAGAPRVDFDDDAKRALLDGFGALHAASVVAGGLILVVLAWRDGLRVGFREREVVLVLLVGLVANATIFGGLSAPADRYQSRIAWIIPLFAALFLLERLARRERHDADLRPDARAAAAPWRR